MTWSSQLTTLDFLKIWFYLFTRVQKIQIKKLIIKLTELYKYLSKRRNKNVNV